MSKSERCFEKRARRNIFIGQEPKLGYYIIVTDTKETEKNYILGLKRSIPAELQRKLVITVKKTKTVDLVEEALNEASIHPQYGEVWIVFDRDEVKDFDGIIDKAKKHGIKVGWSNPCIETWFNAYFGAMPRCDTSQLCYTEFSTVFQEKTKNKYDKSASDIYEKLNEYGDEKKACQISTERYRNYQNDGINIPSQMESASTLFMLIDEIKSKVIDKAAH